MRAVHKTILSACTDKIKLFGSFSLLFFLTHYDWRVLFSIHQNLFLISQFHLIS